MGRASQRETEPLTRRPHLSQRGQDSHTEARPLTYMLVLSVRGWPSHIGSTTTKDWASQRGKDIFQLLQGT